MDVFNAGIVCPDKSCLSVISIIFYNQLFFNNNEKRLAVQQVLNPYFPIHKHIEARMNMVRKTAKQFYTILK